MLALRGESAVRALYEEAASTLAGGLRADRAAIFYLDDQRTLALGGVHGMAAFPMSDCPISQSLLDEVWTRDRSVVFGNVPKDTDARDNLSLQLSGAVSLLCVPFYDDSDKPAGVLYADTDGRVNAFHRDELLFARDCANWLECCLAGRDNLSKPEPISLSPAARPAARPSARPKETADTAKAALRATAATATGSARPQRGGLSKPLSQERVRSASRMVFFRSLATLMGAGVHINASLELLGEAAEDPGMGRISGELAVIVSQGEPLSAAMERFPKVFPPAVRATVRLGEQTGRLVAVLEVLSTDLEKSQRTVYRLRSALTYPAILAAACGLMLLFGPPYLLQGHLRMLQSSGVPLPLFTQLMLVLSAALRSPVVLLMMGLLLAAGAVRLRSPEGRHRAGELARRTPGLGDLLELLDLTLFVRTLSLQLRAGMTAVEALQQARQGTESSTLKEALRQTERAVRNGATFSEAFNGTGRFSPVFLSFVEAGEQSGSLPRLVGWLADFQERELEARVDALVALAEPIIMAVMGGVAGVLLVATIKPTMLILQTL